MLPVGCDRRARESAPRPLDQALPVDVPFELVDDPPAGVGELAAPDQLRDAVEGAFPDLVHRRVVILRPAGPSLHHHTCDCAVPFPLPAADVGFWPVRWLCLAVVGRKHPRFNSRGVTEPLAGTLAEAREQLPLRFDDASSTRQRGVGVRASGVTLLSPIIGGSVNLQQRRRGRRVEACAPAGRPRRASGGRALHRGDLDEPCERVREPHLPGRPAVHAQDARARDYLAYARAASGHRHARRTRPVAGNLPPSRAGKKAHAVMESLKGMPAACSSYALGTACCDVQAIETSPVRLMCSHPSGEAWARNSAGTSRPAGPAARRPAGRGRRGDQPLPRPRLRRTRRPARTRQSACAPCAGATCSSSGSSTVSAATSPTWSTPYRTCRPAAWACGCSPARARRSIPPPRPADSCSASSRRWPSFERELIRERTLAGLKAARARGRKGGRKFALSKAQGAAGPGRDGPP